MKLPRISSPAWLPLPVLIVLPWLTIVGCHRGSPPGASATPPLLVATVQVVTVGTETNVSTEEVVGTVRAKLRATLEAKMSGRIEELPVGLGQSVTAGTLLVRLDAREVQARLDQAMAVRQQAERELSRYTTLLKQEAVTQAEFDAVEARSRVAQAAAAEAETLLDYARVVAPFTGVITRKLADVGDLASPGRPLLEIEDPAAFRLEADVPEAIVGRLKTGARLPVQVPALGQPLEGTLVELAPVADPVSRTFRAKLDLPATPGLMSGQFGRVTIPLEANRTLRVPLSAVIQRGQLEMVFVATNGQAQMRLVKTGRRTAGAVELLSGIEAGEQVVSEGAASLREFQPLEIRPR